MTLLSHGQEIVLNHHLTEYPTELQFDDILYMIENDSDHITIWAPFEDWEIEMLTKSLRYLSSEIDRRIVNAADKL